MISKTFLLRNFLLNITQWSIQKTGFDFVYRLTIDQIFFLKNRDFTGTLKSARSGLIDRIKFIEVENLYENLFLKAQLFSKEAKLLLLWV